MHFMNENKFNGWANYETWNVALYIQNDYALYKLAKTCADYQDFSDAMRYDFSNPQTPDGVRYDCDKLDVPELDELISSLKQ